VVQDPRDAVHPSMPEHALARVAVDHCLALKDLGTLLNRLAHVPVINRVAVPEDILLEAQIVERAAMPDVEKEARLGTLVPLSCPECGGPLRQLDHGEVPRYRCQIGHAFTAGSLLSSQDDAIEQSLWVALRTLEERHSMLEGLAREERRRGRSDSAGRYEQRAAESHVHVERLRALLLEAARRDAG
ncbi:MAG: chemotaxis protein CheB, partial [Pseudomonadota bacterium]|nr:chemotaxis protein CheB [Pseudomonadota bacterium]